MEITGRLTADAIINNTGNERQVVNFAIAINDHFRTKDGERKNIVTYVNCSYWISTKVADKLTKGTIVLLYGRIGVNAYTSMDGEPRASLTFHVNNIKFIGGGKSIAATTEQPQEQFAAVTETADDLPF